MMLLHIIAGWLSTLIVLACPVCALLIGCGGDKKEKSLQKKRESLDMGVSDLDEVQPVKREVLRAQEIKDGARGKKAEYKTLAQMEKSDFDKSMHAPPSVEAPPTCQAPPTLAAPGVIAGPASCQPPARKPHLLASSVRRAMRKFEEAVAATAAAALSDAEEAQAVHAGALSLLATARKAAAKTHSADTGEVHQLLASLAVSAAEWAPPSVEAPPTCQAPPTLAAPGVIAGPASCQQLTAIVDGPPPPPLYATPNKQ
ncbi:hypothetical protein PRIPAC_70157, partial [Pristionchus pacificus]|uniref:Uncharacterized protein n=1 Tax=Pristionchus pacificus TaxID=54126 RepID=A0A2A6C6P4_PRIPA